MGCPHDCSLHYEIKLGLVKPIPPYRSLDTKIDPAQFLFSIRGEYMEVAVLIRFLSFERQQSFGYDILIGSFE
jgi:hypothetical protein